MTGVQTCALPISPLVTAIEMPSSIEQEVRDDMVAGQIKETKREGTKRDKRLREMRD